MEGDINKSHIIMGVRKVYLIAFLCPRVANKYAFENARGELGQGRRLVLNKDSASKDLKRRGEERRGG